MMMATLGRVVTSNYATWSIKMRVNLQAQGVYYAIENGNDIEKRKDMMTLVAIYQVVLEDVFLMVAKKDSIKVA